MYCTVITSSQKVFNKCCFCHYTLPNYEHQIYALKNIYIYIYTDTVHNRLYTTDLLSSITMKEQFGNLISNKTFLISNNYLEQNFPQENSHIKHVMTDYIILQMVYSLHMYRRTAE